METLKEVIDGQRDYVLLEGHVLDTLNLIPDDTVQCVVTSSPYFGARNYGTQWQLWDGDKTCEHKWAITPPRRQRNPKDVKDVNTIQNSNKGANCGLPNTQTCLNCGGWFGELGLEQSPSLFVRHLASIFKEVKRILRKDGTIWINIGDTYTGYHGNKQVGDLEAPSNKDGYIENMRTSTVGIESLKEKELCGIPWHLAFALQDDGWYLRSDICWAKTNCQPESVKDRPTRSWEHIFLLTKSPRYYYDQDAIREPHSAASLERVKHPFYLSEVVEGRAISSPENGDMTRFCHPLGANKRDVWTMPASEGININGGRHYASFPLELPITCLKAGSKKGDIVLDPFSGSATTGIAALQNGRRYIGCELSKEYIELSKKRIDGKEPLFQM